MAEPKDDDGKVIDVVGAQKLDPKTGKFEPVDMRSLSMRERFELFKAMGQKLYSPAELTLAGVALSAYAIEYANPNTLRDLVKGSTPMSALAKITGGVLGNADAPAEGDDEETDHLGDEAMASLRAALNGPVGQA